MNIVKDRMRFLPRFCLFGVTILDEPSPKVSTKGTTFAYFFLSICSRLIFIQTSVLWTDTSICWLQPPISIQAWERHWVVPRGARCLGKRHLLQSLDSGVLTRCPLLARVFSLFSICACWSECILFPFLLMGTIALDCKRIKLSLWSEIQL